MDSVKRYSRIEVLNETDPGWGWYRALDYKALQSRLAAVEAEHDKLQGKVSSLNVENSSLTKALAKHIEQLTLPVDPEDERANPVWDAVIRICQQAWPEEKRTDYCQSPTELITRIIDERDQARQELTEACERAAKECERYGSSYFAAKIRALKPSGKEEPNAR